MLQIMACIGGSNHLKRIPNHIIQQIGTRVGTVFELYVRESVNLFSRPQSYNEICNVVASYDRYIMESYYDNNNKIEYLFAKEVNMQQLDFDEWCFEIINDNREIYK